MKIAFPSFSHNKGHLSMKPYFQPSSGRVVGIFLAFGWLACNVGLAQTVG